MSKKPPFVAMLFLAWSGLLPGVAAQQNPRIWAEQGMGFALVDQLEDLYMPYASCSRVGYGVGYNARLSLLHSIGVESQRYTRTGYGISNSRFTGPAGTIQSLETDLTIQQITTWVGYRFEAHYLVWRSNHWELGAFARAGVDLGFRRHIGHFSYQISPMPADAALPPRQIKETISYAPRLAGVGGLGLRLGLALNESVWLYGNLGLAGRIPAQEYWFRDLRRPSAISDAYTALYGATNIITFAANSSPKGYQTLLLFDLGLAYTLGMRSSLNAAL